MCVCACVCLCVCVCHLRKFQSHLPTSWGAGAGVRMCGTRHMVSALYVKLLSPYVGGGVFGGLGSCHMVVHCSQS